MPWFLIIFFAGYVALLCQAVSFHRRCFLHLVSEVPEVRNLKYKESVSSWSLFILRVANIFIGFPLIGLALLVPGVEQHYRESLVNSILVLKEVDVLIKRRMNRWARG